MRVFTVSDVEASRESLSPATLSTSLEARSVGSVEGGASNLAWLVAGESHGFLQAVHYSFARHLPLVLSPDDVWLCLVQAFGTHVNLHAETLRHQLVAHRGKMVISVRRDHFVKGSLDNDWPGVFAEFTDELTHHLGKQSDLVVADFSTTGAVEKAASQVVQMSAVQQYLDYELVTFCGIPRISLLGTTEDWRSIRRRAEVFAGFGLDPWVRALIPILDQFVAASDGSVDREFWRSFYKLFDESGGPYVSGWINVLFPYIEAMEPSKNRLRGPGMARPNPYLEPPDSSTRGHHDLGTRSWEFPTGLSTVPFIWKYLGQEIAMEFVGGFVGVSQEPETLEVRPAMGWAVREALSEKHGSTSPEEGS